MPSPLEFHKEKLRQLALSIQPSICRHKDADLILLQHFGITVHDWQDILNPRRLVSRQTPQLPPPAFPTTNSILWPQPMPLAHPQALRQPEMCLLPPHTAMIAPHLQQQPLHHPQPPTHPQLQAAPPPPQQQQQQQRQQKRGQQQQQAQQQQTQQTHQQAPQQPVPKLNRAVKGKSNGAGRTYTSKFRGVHQTFPTKRWEAQFRRNGKPTSLGCFDREDQAAEAYDKMMLWCELHNTAGVKGGITNYDASKYEEIIPWLRTIAQVSAQP
ncbi:hypothetical protein DUNSADRAFT_16578 [Dunaliella salina]|uniref:AP2/ERF domain-containing protein n=1 Tax=Dunaliella salina TaxID=3046 RepID=A0ABQ7H0W2_DUNSA|nr:hypothetical protein DUNSADRAFT_16578 [Dunaliella salina]|eukprot:KAF5840487.1 hypothetical protein DUNSADRAFT_16578 [Dunaliella salina]